MFLVWQYVNIICMCNAMSLFIYLCVCICLTKFFDLAPSWTLVSTTRKAPSAFAAPQEGRGRSGFKIFDLHCILNEYFNIHNDRISSIPRTKPNAHLNRTEPNARGIRSEPNRNSQTRTETEPNRNFLRYPWKLVWDNIFLSTKIHRRF